MLQKKLRRLWSNIVHILHWINGDVHHNISIELAVEVNHAWDALKVIRVLTMSVNNESNLFLEYDGIWELEIMVSTIWLFCEICINKNVMIYMSNLTSEIDSMSILLYFFYFNVLKLATKTLHLLIVSSVKH